MIVDLTGKNLILPGCRIAYPVRAGSSMWMVVITVDQVIEQRGNVRVIGHDKDGFRRYTRNTLNCVVIK
jgi:hypothetical protein